MDGWSGKDIENIIAKNCKDFRDYYANFKQLTDNLLVETITYMRGLRDNPSELIPSVSSVERAPRQSRKKRVTRIETIVEDDSELESGSSSATRRLAREEVDEEDEEEKQLDAPPTRSRRVASLRAANNIKKQQTSALNVKLRRPSESEDVTLAVKEKDAKPRKRTDTSPQKEEEEEEKDSQQLVPRIVVTRERSSKRAKASSNGFDEEEEEEGRRPSKRSRRERKQQRSGRKGNEDVVDAESRSPATKRKLEEERASSRGGASAAKKANRAAASETPKASDATFDLSLNDATLGRPTPISSSTLKCANSTIVLGRNANLTYCLEKDATMTLATASAAEANATMTLATASAADANATMTIATASGAAEANATIVLESQLRQLRMNQTVVLEKRSLARPSDSLITEDDSSPERKTVRKPRSAKKKQQQAARNAAARRTSSSEEDVPVTPSVSRQPPRMLKDGKNAAYKPSALFSPYAKDSVRKRVQAFEQVGMNSPKSVEVEAPMRLTRTKTRALAAAEAGANVAAQKAARKSLAKAKKISLARQMRDDGGEEAKENQELGPAQRFNRAVAANEKLLAKQQQQRITPVGKSRILMPASSSRIPRTPAMSQLFPNNLKAMSATRPNIVTHVESFLPLVRPLRKSNSADKTEEKKRRVYDEDARKKREEALRAKTEEKRRKREEKELKNKLAREAKEKQDMEKRMKAEQEREEKARLALLMQERQREEAEKRRMIQQQRAQEKEERRRQEEQLRAQRLREQEEAERQLAEQRRREQEAEKRRLIEARAQQQAAAEATRLKAQYLVAQAKEKQQQAMNSKKPEPTNYIIDTDPSDAETDDESRPKHEIPFWAKSNVRRQHLAMQKYAPIDAVHKFFGSRKCTPDLRELFVGIDTGSLKRTSSAIWKTPPRFSMMEDE